MVKKSIVLLQGAVVFVLGALLFGQLHMTPGAARSIDRSRPLWFMHPFRQGAPETAATSQQPATGTTDAASSEVAKLAEANRRSILAPVPSLNAVITDLEGRDLPPSGDMLVPGERVQSPAPARKPVRRRPRVRKTPASGPLRLTGLTVHPTADGATIRVSTSAPAERIALFTFSSPPRMVLELDGNFSEYSQPIVVPPNQIFQALTTEQTQGKMRITGTLLTSKAYVVPVTSSSQDSFTVGMTLNPDGQPNFETRP